MKSLPALRIVLEKLSSMERVALAGSPLDE